MTDDGLLLWQRIALERGEPVDVPPQQRRDNTTPLAGPVASQQAASTDEYLIELPWPRPPLNHNHRLTYWAKGALQAEVRKTAWALVRQAALPRCTKITVQFHYAPGRRGRRDPMNLTATTKPVIDGIVDAGVVPDDDSEHVHELTPEIHFPPAPGPRCWLIITAEVSQ
jgi:crossover junction endodeoxyribonuclease RusA